MDRIARVEFQNLRLFEHVVLEPAGLTVIVGENGAGKSTVIEGLEILRRMGSPDFVEELNTIHRALIVRHGAPTMGFRVDIVSDSGEPPLTYGVGLYHGVGLPTGSGFLRVSSESLMEGAEGGPQKPIYDGALGYWSDEANKYLSPPGGEMEAMLFAPRLLSSAAAFRRLNQALRTIRVHVPFDATPQWASQATNRPRSPMREPAPSSPAPGLSLFAHNLANVWRTLREAPDWDVTLDLVRLGLGDKVEDIEVRPQAEGTVALFLKTRNSPALPASVLSNGTLTWLAFVAIYRSPERPSLLAFDEIDLHLHPQLLGRVLELCESMARRHPVLLTTHSERLLDMLTDPAQQVVLATQDERGVGKLLRPNPEQLAWFREKYAWGYGQIRAEGYEPLVYEPSR